MVGKLDSRPLGAVRGTARLYRAMARAVLENRREDVDKLGVSLASSEIMGWKEGRKREEGKVGATRSVAMVLARKWPGSRGSGHARSSFLDKSPDLFQRAVVN